MLYWVRCEKLLDVQYFIFFLRILQKLSNILHPSRQNWTTEVCFFLQKEDNSWKYLSQLLLTSYKLLATPFIIIPWANRICIALLLSPLHYTFTAIAADSLNNCTLNYRGYCIIVSDPNPVLIVLLMSDNNLVSPFWKISAPSLILKTVKQ